MKLKKAEKKDIPQLKFLLNKAYRGEESKKGWTTEAFLLKGEVRTDIDSLNQIFDDPNSVMVKYENEAGKIMGCVHLKKNENRLYLGMLCVSPTEQGKGIGKMFLRYAEQHARSVECSKIYMQIISVRKELNDWYRRHGYAPTGERFPFDVDEKYGMQTEPLEFMIMEKWVG